MRAPITYSPLPPIPPNSTPSPPHPGKIFDIQDARVRVLVHSGSKISTVDELMHLHGFEAETLLFQKLSQR